MSSLDEGRGHYTPTINNDEHAPIASTSSSSSTYPIPMHYAGEEMEAQVPPPPLLPPPIVPGRSHRRTPSTSNRNSLITTNLVANEVGLSTSKIGGAMSKQSPTNTTMTSDSGHPPQRRLTKSFVHQDLVSVSVGASSPSSSASIPPPPPLLPPRPVTPIYNTSGYRGEEESNTPKAMTNERSSRDPPSTLHQQHGYTTSIPDDDNNNKNNNSRHSIIKPLHEPPILMPSFIARPSLHNVPSSSVDTNRSSSSSVYDERSDSDSAESYGWTGIEDPLMDKEGIDGKILTKAPLFSEEGRRGGDDDAVVVPGYRDSSTSSPSPSPSTFVDHHQNPTPTRRSTVENSFKESTTIVTPRRGFRSTSISRADSIEGDQAAWWKNPSSPLTSPTSSSTGFMESSTKLMEEDRSKSLGNGVGLKRVPSSRRSAYEARGSPTKMMNPETTQTQTTVKGGTSLRLQTATPLPDRDSSPAFHDPTRRATDEKVPPTSSPTSLDSTYTSTSLERPSLKPNPSSSGSDELVIPPKSPRRISSASLRRDLSQLSLRDGFTSPTSVNTNTTSGRSTPGEASPGGGESGGSLFERKPKRAVPAPRPQKSRHRASASLAGKVKFLDDNKTVELEPKSLTISGEAASTSSTTLDQESSQRRSMTLLSHVPPIDVAAAARFPPGRFQLEEPPLSASDFAMAYGQFDRSPSLGGQSRRSSHIRSPASADAPAFSSAPPTTSSSSSGYVLAPAFQFASEETKVPITPKSTTTSQMPRRQQETSSLETQLTEAIADAANLEHDLSIADGAGATTVYPSSGPKNSRSSELDRPGGLHVTTKLKSQFDRPVSIADNSDVNSARASSPGFSSEDVYHDASADGSVNFDTNRYSIVSEGNGGPTNQPSSTTGLSSAGIGNGSGGAGKLDAKARAAAFVADLKKARVAAAAAIPKCASPSPSSPLSASGSLILPPAPVSLSETDGVGLGSPREVLKQEAGDENDVQDATFRPSRSSVVDSFPHAQIVPFGPESGSRRSASVVSAASSFSSSRPQTPLRSGQRSPSFDVDRTPVSPIRSYTLHPPSLNHNGGRTSSRTSLIPGSGGGGNTSNTTLASSSSSAANYLPPPAVDAASSNVVYFPSVTAATSPTRPELRRRRPLPASLQIIDDLKKTRTAGDRANVYAAKIKALRRETSGIVSWVVFVQAGHANGTSTTQTISLNPSKHVRDEGSSASFPMRPDASRAREITTGSFSRQDLIPTVPYPGVLPPGPSHHSPSTSLPTTNWSSPLPNSSSSAATSRYSTPLTISTTGGGSAANTSTNHYHSARPASAIKDKASFFTSLGRKSSRRESVTASASTGNLSAVAAAGSNVPVGGGGGGGGMGTASSNPRRMSVSAPFNVSASATNTVALTSAVPISTIRATIRAIGLAGPRQLGANHLNNNNNNNAAVAPTTTPTTLASLSMKPSQESLIGTTNRTSFIYGTSNINAATAGGQERSSLESTTEDQTSNMIIEDQQHPFFPPNTIHSFEPFEHERTTAGGNVVDEMEEEKIQRLVDILPYATRDQIRFALQRAGGDDVLAISIFLSDDP